MEDTGASFTRQHTAILWNGSVRSLSYQDRLRVAQLAGYSRLSMNPQQFLELQKQGWTAARIVARAQEYGIRVSHLDPLSRWSSAWRPTNLPASWISYFQLDTRSFLDIADALEVTSITAISTGAAGTASIDQLTDEFGRLCEAGSRRGLHVGLEFIPFGWNIPDLATAWRIIDGASMPNSSLIIDTWHFFASGSSLELLSAIPDDRLRFLQLADGNHAVRTLPLSRRIEAGLNQRLAPGSGDFDLAALTRAILRSGPELSLGPEILSTGLDHLSLSGVAAVCGSSVRRLLQECDAASPIGFAIDDSRAVRHPTCGESSSAGRGR